MSALVHDDSLEWPNGEGFMANSCTSAWKSPGGDEAKKIIGRRDDTFSHPALFYEHHTGQPYVRRIFRIMNGEAA